MNFSHWIGLIILGLTLPFPANAAAEKKKTEIKIRFIDSKEAAKVSYSRDIKPLLVNNCIECHSPEDKKSGFDATTVSALLEKGKKAGKGVIPGKPDESAIVQYIRGLAEGPQMPKGSEALSENELHLIRLWIAAGAKDDSADASSQTTENSSFGSLNAEAQQLLNRLLYDTLSVEQRFIVTRQFRTTLLPNAPKVPDIAAPSSGSVNPIDAFIISKWNEAKLPEAKNPPSLCDDATFVRRVYLDVIGRTPSAESARKFVVDSAPDKRTRLIDTLLARNDDYAAHWTPFWEEALCSSTTELNGGIGARGNHRDWILESFKKNKPFDLFAAELIDPTLPGYRAPKFFEPNGHRVVSAYIKSEDHMETLQTAANVGQVFLGTGMKCASCHSHFLNKEWPQARFAAFAGMFGPRDLELIRCEKKSGQMISAKFPFDLPGLPADAPRDLTNRLHRVAQLLIDPTNPRFGKTIVNRLWKRYVGLGLFEPVDDFRLDQLPSHPQLLDWLTQDFIRNGYDIKHTARLILTSRTYQWAYDPDREDHFNVQKPKEPRYFRSPALRRLTAEQFLDSIRASTSKDWKNEKRTYLEKGSTPLTQSLGRPPAHNEVSTGRSDDVAVVQSLELLNGTALHALVYTNDVTKALTEEENASEMVEKLYWLVLSRAPHHEEEAIAVHYVQGEQPPGSKAEAGNAKKGREQTAGDLLWSLFTSPEFQYVR
jgi:mono/diheme cytochrome c family protein